MIRTQIQLTEQQVRKLRRMARAEGVSVAELIRRFVEEGITSESALRTGHWDRALGIVGKFRDREGATDVGSEHDRYLEDTYD